MPLAKLADRAEIRVAQPRHRHKVDALVARPIDPPRRVDPLAVGIKLKCRHHPRMVGRITPLLVVLRENRLQIQSLTNRLPDQVCNVPGRHKVLHRGRKQPHLIHVPRAKNLAHTVQRIELLAPCPLRFLLLPGQAPRASEVLPIPPVPTMVSRRSRRNCSASLITVPARPTNRVGEAGKLCERRAEAVGTAAGSASSVSLTTETRL